MIRGSCLCGGVRFEVAGPLFASANCHCGMCRKAHGAAFRPSALARSQDFRWTAGEELMTDYASSPAIRRSFCGVCGSPLVARADGHPGIVSLALGVIDDDPGIRPEAHWNVAFKAPWHEITDDLSQLPGPPG